MIKKVKRYIINFIEGIKDTFYKKIYKFSNPTFRNFCLISITAFQSKHFRYFIRQREKRQEEA